MGLVVRMHARVCEGLRGCAKACEVLSGLARTCEGLRGCAWLFEGVRGRARASEDVFYPDPLILGKKYTFSASCVQFSSASPLIGISCFS